MNTLDDPLDPQVFSSGQAAWENENLRPDPATGDFERLDGLRKSLAIHGLLLALVLLASLVFQGNPIPILPTLRVDVVGLPDALKKDLQTPGNPSPALSELSKQIQAAVAESVC